MRRLLTTVLPLLALAIAALVLVPALLGYERYVITSGSMSGSYDRGSVIFDRVVPVGELRAGDVITFTPPGARDLVTHRIVSVESGPDGRPALRTKGDANESADPWTFTPNGDRLPRVSGSVPYVGYVLAALSIPWVRALVLGLPALLVAFVLLTGPHPRDRDGRPDPRRRPLAPWDG